MKKIDHWTPRYVLDRAVVAVDAKRHPDHPWWTPEAVRALDSLLRPTDECFEWGSGRSTRWLAQRTARIVSIEHDRAWYDRMAPAIQGRTSEVRLVDAAAGVYVAAIDGEGDFDLVVVDGLHRDGCALAALAHLRPGGILLLDDAERYVPNASRSPQSIGDGFETEAWKQFAAEVGGWRRLWTASGVTDTALFFKP